MTGEERSVVASDEILLPNYRLPTAAELKWASQHVKDYSKHRALRAFQKKVLAHRALHPKPIFYDHQQYNLPSCIMDSGTEGTPAPYHLKDTIDEWQQQSAVTSDRYNWSYYLGRGAEDRPQVFTPIGVQLSTLSIDTTGYAKWQKQVPRAYGTVDTAIINKFAQQHTNKAVPYKSFRCVMPNLW